MPRYSLEDRARNYQKVLRRLFQISKDIQRRLVENPRNDMPSYIIQSYLLKGTQTLEAILLLYTHDLHHQGQALVRVIFELNITFEVLATQLRQHPQKACQRFNDGWILEKIKQARASSFQGFELVQGAPSPKEIERHEDEIKARYTQKEFNAIRRHGFSGVSVEERARQAGVKDTYDIVYRNFSRNIHSADFTELFRMVLKTNPALFKTKNPEYEQLRDIVSYDVAFMSALAIAALTDDILRLGFDIKLRQLKSRRDMLR